jgi:hypothetical protein
LSILSILPARRGIGRHPLGRAVSFPGLTAKGKEEQPWNRMPEVETKSACEKAVHFLAMSGQQVPLRKRKEERK